MIQFINFSDFEKLLEAKKNIENSESPTNPVVGNQALDEFVLMLSKSLYTLVSNHKIINFTYMIFNKDYEYVFYDGDEDCESILSEVLNKINISKIKDISKLPILDMNTEYYNHTTPTQYIAKNGTYYKI